MNGKYSDKVNTSRNQLRIKKILEKIGHTTVEVWWEPVGRGYEMAGPDGGVFFTSDQYDYINPIGYTFTEAEECVKEEYVIRNNGILGAIGE